MENKVLDLELFDILDWYKLCFFAASILKCMDFEC